jgi:hypothetical protein
VPETIIAAGATWVSDPNTDGTINGRRRAAFKKWWFGVLINQDRSMREKMTIWQNVLQQKVLRLIMHNTFTTS